MKAASIDMIAALVGLLLWGTLATGKGRSFVARIAAGEAPAAPASSSR